METKKQMICKKQIKSTKSKKSPKTQEKKPNSHLDSSRLFHSFGRLRLYLPCNKITKAYMTQFSRHSLAKISENFSHYLEKPELNSVNICEVLKVLLQMEDLSNMAQYIELIQGNAIFTELGCILKNADDWRFFLKEPTINQWKTSIVFLCKKFQILNHSQHILQLEKMDDVQQKIQPYLDEAVIVPKGSISQILFETKRGSKKNSVDIILPHPQENRNMTDPKLQRHVATICEISRNKILIECCDQLIENKKYSIIFRPVRTQFRYEYQALEMLAKQPKIRNFLFPELSRTKPTTSTIENTKTLELVNGSIAQNPEQLKAVRTIVEHNQFSAPFIIVGPPGTGKTTTIVEMIIQLRLHRPQSRILVTASSNSVCDTLALRLLNYYKEKSELELVRIFSKSIEENTKFQHIDKSIIEISNCCGDTHFYPDVTDIRQYKIIIATLSIVGKLVGGGIGANNFFTHVIIDEAASATETEALLGIMGIVKPNQCSVILAGDPKQLGPVVLSKTAAELGLKRSLMDRLLERKCYALDANGDYDHSLQVRLRRNYRSHPEIVRLYNHLYYNNELLSSAKQVDVNQYVKWCHLPNAKFPIIFQAVHGVCLKKPNSTSSYNILEIESIMCYLRHILRDGINGVKVKQTDVGIITPYKLQSSLIERQLKNHCWSNVEVGSVEIFQGQEKPIIIVSIVRSSESMGFIGEPRRLNVILSRAKSLLILIGNPIALRQNDDLKFIIDECNAKSTLLRSNTMSKESKNIKPSTTSSKKSKRASKTSTIQIYLSDLITQKLKSMKIV